MKNKAKALDLSIHNSGIDEKNYTSDYPDYPECDDNYNLYLEREEIDPKNIFKTKASPHISKKHESIQKSYRIAMASTP